MLASVHLVQYEKQISCHDTALPPKKTTYKKSLFSNIGVVLSEWDILVVHNPIVQKGIFFGF